MSKAQQPPQNEQTVWDELAEHEDTLEMLVDRDLPLADEADTLLQELDKRGLR